MYIQISPLSMYTERQKTEQQICGMILCALQDQLSMNNHLSSNADHLKGKSSPELP